jgi:ABC-type dipeptide/oligopeptide/nickel transport system permease component
LLSCVLVIAANVLIDGLQTWIDPRLRTASSPRESGAR